MLQVILANVAAADVGEVRVREWISEYLGSAVATAVWIFSWVATGVVGGAAWVKGVIRAEDVDRLVDAVVVSEACESGSSAAMG